MIACNVVGDSNVSPDNDSKENSKGMEDDMFGDFLQQMTMWLLQRRNQC